MSLSKFQGDIVPKADRTKLSRQRITKSDNERFRPVNDDLVKDILHDNENKNTAKSEKKVHKILVKYLHQTKQNENYCDYSIDELDQMLSKFWFAVSPEKEGSDHYTVSSLHHIRYAIKRLLQNAGREFDITTDPIFANNQRLFKEACKELKRKGFGHVKHTDAIKPSDLRLIFNSELMDPDRSPYHLQRKVMFDIRYYMCHRGGENIADMTKFTFQLEYDTDSNISYVRKVEDEIQKNHQEYDSEVITGFMPQMRNADGTVHKLCPVRAFENYIAKLDPKNDFLWQKPVPKFPSDPSKPWYENKKVGHNTHDKFMANLCEKLKMTTRYTNHCIRVTGITNLRRGSFNAKQVMSVSGHKSVESLPVYERVQADEKMMMGMCLSYTLLHPEDAVMIQNNLEIQHQVPELPHNQPKQITYQQEPLIQNEVKQLIPLENGITPYQPAQEISDNPDFDLMSLIAEVEHEEIPDEDLVLAATQCKKSITENLTTPTTTTKTALMKKTSSYPTPTFTGCTFGSVGTINIHIHKH